MVGRSQDDNADDLEVGRHNIDIRHGLVDQSLGGLCRGRSTVGGRGDRLQY